jgi:hypothetical protein
LLRLLLLVLLVLRQLLLVTWWMTDGAKSAFAEASRKLPLLHPTNSTAQGCLTAT